MSYKYILLNPSFYLHRKTMSANSGGDSTPSWQRVWTAQSTTTPGNHSADWSGDDHQNWSQDYYDNSYNAEYYPENEEYWEGADGSYGYGQGYNEGYEQFLGYDEHGFEYDQYDQSYEQQQQPNYQPPPPANYQQPSYETEEAESSSMQDEILANEKQVIEGVDFTRRGCTRPPLAHEKQIRHKQTLYCRRGDLPVRVTKKKSEKSSGGAKLAGRAKEQPTIAGLAKRDAKKAQVIQALAKAVPGDLGNELLKHPEVLELFFKVTDIARQKAATETENISDDEDDVLVGDFPSVAQKPAEKVDTGWVHVEYNKAKRKFTPIPCFSIV